MSSPSPEVDIKPAILKWARESSGWKIEDISKKLKVSAAKYEEWESTGRAIKITHLEALVKHYKRSLAFFFLPAPPTEPKPPKDFRVIPGRKGKFETKTLVAIRRATFLQTVASELFDNLALSKEPQVEVASTDESPEAVGQRERKRLGVTVSEQLGWRDASVALRRWRDAVEAKSILVFSLSMPVDDARGFTLSEEHPWAIVINSSDAVRARAFTLFHEYGHLLLHRPGVCIPQREWLKHVKLGEVERWCNAFAAALLLPRDALGELGWDVSTQVVEEYVAELSRRFKVSEEVALRRLLTLNLVSEQQFREQIERIRRTTSKAAKKSGHVSPSVASVSGRGRLFTRLVLQGQERGVLTYKDVSDLLAIRLKHLDKVSSLAAA